MDPLILGLLAAVVLIMLLLSGMPVAFALGFTAVPRYRRRCGCF